MVMNVLGDNGILGHNLEVLRRNDVAVTSGGDEDVGAGSSLLHGRDLITSHRGLESVDGVNLGDEDTSTVGPERLGALKRLSAT